MGFLDKAKAAAETATTKAKEGIGEVQTRREFSQAYDELGKLDLRTRPSGRDRARRELGELVEKIRSLKSRGRRRLNRAAAAAQDRSAPARAVGRPCDDLCMDTQTIDQEYDSFRASFRTSPGP